MAGFAFHSFAATSPGSKRTLNEDCFVDRADAGLWAVADGAGGHASGDVASAMICAGLARIAAGLPGEQTLAEVRESLQATHAALQQQAAARTPPATIASTVVVLLAQGDFFACLWVGDSRAYLLRDGALIQLTRDHSLVQSLVDAGAITPEEAERHPQANVITRAVGGGAALLEADKVTDRLLAGDRFLLCSDGLSKTLATAELAALLAAPQGVPPPDLLINAALAHDAADNITAVTMEVRAAADQRTG